MKIKKSWWSLTIHDSQYQPNEFDLQHIAKLIEQGFSEGELIQEIEEDGNQLESAYPSAFPSSWLPKSFYET